MNKYLSLIIVASLLSGPVNQIKCMNNKIKNIFLATLFGGIPVTLGITSYIKEKKEKKSIFETTFEKIKTKTKKHNNQEKSPNLKKEDSILTN